MLARVADACRANDRVFLIHHMRNLLALARVLVTLFALCLICHTRAEDSDQVLFAQDLHWELDVKQESLGAPHALGVTHPVPPGRGHGTDPWNLSSFTNTTFHETYHPLFEIDEYLEHLAALYPENVTIHELGHSAEGREMYAMRITGGNVLNEDGQTRVKRGFVISGAQHAREWVASASALYIAHALLADSSETNTLTHLLTDFDFYIIPVPNPDGYVYTWESDRLWYKNRMLLGPNEPCQGLDMNRYWGYHWSPSEFPTLTSSPLEDFDTLEPDEAEALRKKKGKKPKKPKKPRPSRPPPADPCSHWFPGRRPFEAPEVNNIANYVMQLPELVAFMDLRSYGQMLSWPYSYSCDMLPADAENLYEAALGAAAAIRKKHGTAYTTGSLCSMLYSAPGNILDWMYASAGVKYSYAVHLRDTGTYGYSLPREWIRPVGEETGTIVDYIIGFITSSPK
ncbi:uncharacterized protein FOMMEDRAFT_137991 [Fomitiporia mediterranea MF3/22]|uniref:uncharacterized protein n=1 Tax=Fomitiporia mediterranea (strain MF3/22) TaxID=694068 RepID=UPI00044075CA|nr:uncharacterized protein FOMMEDRAFT_137991 [Fomitiporia mediterranea MF3/22]EJD07834.1 hypothetical protein FOMMEDRAFT_137991 [Fomitiporia mediterranea MF3/22]